MTQVDRFFSQEGSGDGIVVAVVGNKRDLVDDADSGRVVTSADGANLAKVTLTVSRFSSMISCAVRPIHDLSTSI